jgi:Family of unknown function (DUF5317)
MILFFGAIVLALVVGLVAGGSLHRFSELRLRWWLLAPIGLALQGVPLPDGRHGSDLAIRMIVFGTSYVLLLAFAIRNRRTAGVPLIAVGLLLNGLVVTANGGMPVSRSAFVVSGQVDELHLLMADEGAKHHILVPGEDVLSPLGDVIAVPPPIAQVVSIGDVCVYAGLIWMIVSVMRGRTAGLDRHPESEPYRGRHRRRFRSKMPAASGAPVAATTSGTER